MPDYSNHTITSRMEEILYDMVNDLEYTGNPQSVVEALLIDLNEKMKNARIYKVAGSKAFANLGDPSANTVGFVYSITDAFTTDNRFIDGAGDDFPAGTNVVGIVDVDSITGTETYWWDTLSGFIDLSGYLLKTDAASTYVNKNMIGTAAALNVAESGNASTSEVVKGDDTRLTDSRTPTSHTHITSDISDFPTLGTAAALNVATSGNASTTEVVKGDDTRLTDSRTPTSHTHITSDISDFPTLGTASALNVAESGNASTTEVVKGDDTRLTDSRTPTSHTHTVSDVTDFPTLGTAAALNVAESGNASTTEVVKGDDTRLTDSRTPTSHTHTTSDITDLDLSGKADNSIVAAEFDSTASYAVNDYVMRNGVFYKCTTAHTGAWDANDFTATLISDEFGSGGEEEEAVYRYNFVTKSISGTDATVTVNKYVNDVLESSTDYLFTDIRVTPANIDGRFTFVYQTAAYKYLLTWLQASVEHNAGYSETWRYDESVNFSNTFIVSNKDISYIAPWFTASASYAIGDLVTREEKLYKCTTAHTGAWNDAHFTETTVDAELDNKADVSSLGNAAAKDYTTSVTSGSNDLVTSGGVYSAIDSAITQALNASY